MDKEKGLTILQVKIEKVTEYFKKMKVKVEIKEMMENKWVK
jgi:hypothetical protein